MEINEQKSKIIIKVLDDTKYPGKSSIKQRVKAKYTTYNFKVEDLKGTERKKDSRMKHN